MQVAESGRADVAAVGYTSHPTINQSINTYVYIYIHIYIYI